MVWLVGVFLLLWLAWGPIVPVAAAGLLCVPRLRWWVQDRLRFEARAAATGTIGPQASQSSRNTPTSQTTGRL